MLNTHQQVEFLIAGLYANGAVVPKLAGDDPTTLAHEAYHDDVSSLDEFSSGHEIIDTVLGRWAKTGDLKFIGELVRFAKHRDGSTASLGDSLYAMDLLHAAVISDPAFKAILRNFGYDAEKPTHGDFPNGLTADDFRAPVFVDHPINTEIDTSNDAGQAIPGNAGNPAGGGHTAASALCFAVVTNCRAESDGMVVLEFSGVETKMDPPGIRMGLGAAADLAEELAWLIEEQTLPAAEGFEWLDAEDGSSTILRAEGRKAAALFSDKLRFPGTRDAREVGTVENTDEGTSAPFISAFGGEELARSADLVSAKFTLAQRVREYVAEQSAA